MTILKSLIVLAHIYLKESLLMSKVTIEKIAKLCNVSRGTVDRVIHNRPNVSKEKREKVQKVLEELNYVPNPVARALALHDNKIKIAVILPNWGGFFHSEINKGIEAAIKEFSDYSFNINVYKCETDEPEEYISIIDNALLDEVKGISICAKNSEPLRNKLVSIRKENIPVITFNSDIPNSDRNCFVGEDVLKGGRVAGEIISKLTNEGEKILIACGNFEFYAHKRRVDGFSERFNELNRDNDILPILQTHG